MGKEANVVMMEDTINYIFELIFQEEEGGKNQHNQGLIEILKKALQSQGRRVLAIQNLVPPTTPRKRAVLGLHWCLQPVSLVD